MFKSSIYAIGIIFIWSAYQVDALANGNNAKFDCPADGNYPMVDGECSNSYYICIEGIPYVERCPGESVYDPSIKKCVLLEFSSCANRTSTTSTTVSTSTSTRTTTSRPDFTCPSNGFFAIEGTCDSDYYNCVNGIPYLATCPDNSIFDPILLVCTPPESASCFRCTDPNGFFAIPSNPCGSDYYVCVNNSPYVDSCPSGTFFEPESSWCQAPPMSCDEGAFRCPHPDGRFPDPANCCTGIYYICVNNQPYPEKCPGTSIFDPQLLLCVDRNTASCTPSLSALLRYAKRWISSRVQANAVAKLYGCDFVQFHS